MSSPSLSPMMDQYLRMKQGLPADVLLFFRLGDFYELFFEDAIEAAPILGVTLTKRHSIPMCGVPHHSSENYIHAAIRAGKRVAIAEQTSLPVAGKIVDREIVRIISAGTVAEMSQLNESEHSYIVAVYHEKKEWGLACVDHSTGEFSVAQFSQLGDLMDEVLRIAPRELLISEDQVAAFPGINPTLIYDSYAFLPATALPALLSQFRVHSLEGFGCGLLRTAQGAAGALLHYLKHQLRRSTEHLRKMSVRQYERAVMVDAASQRNLDLVEARGGLKNTLLGSLDQTATPMGARLLRDWILHPSMDLSVLQARQEVVSVFLSEPYLASKLQDSFRQVRDMERLSVRLSQGVGNARDLQALGCSLAQIPHIAGDLGALSGHCTRLFELASSLGNFDEIVELLHRALADEPPVTVKEGGMIRDGYRPDLDELRHASKEGKSWLADMEAAERAATGIESLKIRYNQVFGYYIEVTKSHFAKVPEHYQRKQTLANAERFVTPELKAMEGTILGADERSRQLEYELFLELRQEIYQFLSSIQQSAEVLAEIDVLLGFSQVAQHQQYCRPELNEGAEITIVNGRHPVIEQVQSEHAFVPNDTQMGEGQNRLIIITGPNMAGKSTYIRQVALITLMAQIGSYVPAQEACIGLVDRIFCRVGANDDLARGQSTFMVEMSETALILNNATARSLVILDEIGRGTATFDGLSIAWAVAEHLHDVIAARTLFATHYHELVDLVHTHPAVANWHVAVREWKDEIIFLRKVMPGAADKSYGIQVARLAGMPDVIVGRAKEILTHLEMNANRREPKATRKRNMPESSAAEMTQLELF